MLERGVRGGISGNVRIYKGVSGCGCGCDRVLERGVRGRTHYGSQVTP